MTCNTTGFPFSGISATDWVRFGIAADFGRQAVNLLVEEPLQRQPETGCPENRLVLLGFPVAAANVPASREHKRLSLGGSGAGLRAAIWQPRDERRGVLRAMS